MNMSEKEIQSMLDGVNNDKDVVKKAKFLPLKEANKTDKEHDIKFFGNVIVELAVELGETPRTVREILELEKDSVLSVDRLAGEHVDIKINDEFFASGEIVVINEVLGVRINAIGSAED